MKISILFLFTVIICAFAQGTAEQDRVTLLIPIYTKFPWYSGYLQVSKSSAFHYVFFVSQNDPANDPLILWLNGGPGCSSMLGMLTENGPFVFIKNSTSLKKNPYSWNNKANVLYIESPGQVGFSLGSTNNSDASVARDNLEALKSFFSKFPQYRKNDLYLSGQSYAGVYVPTLAYQIHLFNKNPTTSLQINLKGFIVGNPCTDPDECYTQGIDGTSLFQYEFLYKHAYYSKEQYDRMRAACVLGYSSENCRRIRENLDKAFYNTNSSIYNIYDPCGYQAYSRNKPYGKTISGRIMGDLICDDQIGIMHFLNDKIIREYLHVSMGNSFVWNSCSGDVYNQYQKDPDQSYQYYHLLMKAGYKIWIYSGDVDACVPLTGTVNWLHKLRFDFNVPIQEPWRQWWSTGKHKYEDQVGGMVWKLQNLTVVTVKNAGHMVPTDQPQLAYTMIQAYLNGQDLPDKQFDN